MFETRPLRRTENACVSARGYVDFEYVVNTHMHLCMYFAVMLPV